MTLTSKTLAVLIFPLIFGGIFFSNIMGWWQTESTKQAAVFTSGEYAGQANPADIRGSYTLGDVEDNFDVPADILAEAFNIQVDDPSSFQVKSLEEIYAASMEEIGTSSVRLFVSFYLGVPFDLSTDIYLLEPDADLLRERDLSVEQSDYLGAHVIPVPEVTPETEPLDQQAVSPEPTSESIERLVKGKTTFTELLDWGVSKEAIEQVLGLPVPDSPGLKVKDFCTEKGLSFETIKLALQAEVDRVK